MPDSILVPVDDSELSNRAIRYAVEENPEADLTLLHAYSIQHMTAGGDFSSVAEKMMVAAEEEADEILDLARRTAFNAGHEGTVELIAEEGSPEPVITSHAEDVDAVYIGSHGREGTARVLLGGVAEKVVRRSPVPVTVVK